MRRIISSTLSLILLLAATSLVALAQTRGASSITPADLLKVAAVSDVEISPNGQGVVYTVAIVEGNETVNTLWLARPASENQNSSYAPLLPAGWDATNARWSPDGSKIAFLSKHNSQNGVWVVNLDKREPRFVAGVRTTNFFITYAGETLAWAPDSKRIAYVSATGNLLDASETSARGDDPRVIDRIQYKSRTSFSDRLRTHLWITSIDTPEPRQLTDGEFYDHAITFSPNGDEVAFVSNHEPDPDANNNSDIFAVNMNGDVRQITTTRGCEYEPAWSPDGKWIAYVATKRDITTIDSVAEDTHVWVTDAAGKSARELTSELDRRARSPHWSPSNNAVYFLAGDHGSTYLHAVGFSHLPRIPWRVILPGSIQPTASYARRPFQISSFSIGAKMETVERGSDYSYDGATIAFALSDAVHPAEVWSGKSIEAVRTVGVQIRRLSAHNDAVAWANSVVVPEEINFKSFDGTPIQGWLMKPVGWREDRKYPLILSIHGGPHGMSGWAFNPTFQIYAASGYAVLYINPRGSSGYGQKFSDGTLNEWGGGDYKDLMLGVDEALRRNPWIDKDRMGVTGGSYGGFMTNWIITQTPRFKCAVAVASLSNLVSFYSTSLYQDLIHAEFGGFPWDNYDLLWQWSPLKYVKQVQTPTLFIHGEQDNDVHITQAEEMYTALKRRGVEAVMVRYPREGHGLREPKHRVDALERTVGWFDRFLK
ncbi:MAG TPA: S9 family peptidase [Pyrinomonadaceae bacterium]|nr:S9 family peptidase [Pyrinomonadaceae bacterium]